MTLFKSLTHTTDYNLCETIWFPWHLLPFPVTERAGSSAASERHTRHSFLIIFVAESSGRAWSTTIIARQIAPSPKRQILAIIIGFTACIRSPVLRNNRSPGCSFASTFGTIEMLLSRWPISLAARTSGTVPVLLRSASAARWTGCDGVARRCRRRCSTCAALKKEARKREWQSGQQWSNWEVECLAASCAAVLFCAVIYFYRLIVDLLMNAPHGLPMMNRSPGSRGTVLNNYELPREVCVCVLVAIVRMRNVTRVGSLARQCRPCQYPHRHPSERLRSRWLWLCRFVPPRSEMVYIIECSNGFFRCKTILI